MRRLGDFSANLDRQNRFQVFPLSVILVAVAVGGVASATVVLSLTGPSAERPSNDFKSQAAVQAAQPPVQAQPSAQSQAQQQSPAALAVAPQNAENKLSAPAPETPSATARNGGAQNRGNARYPGYRTAYRSRYWYGRYPNQTSRFSASW